MEGEVLGQEVVRRLADILRQPTVSTRHGRRQRRRQRRTFQAGGVGTALIFFFLSKNQTGRKMVGSKVNPRVNKQGVKHRPPDHSAAQSLSPQRSA